MASLHLMTTTTDQTQEPTKTHFESGSNKPEPVSNRTRKCNKGQTRKKQPQRGMGVAQLERLRLQERWKKITESDQLESLNLQQGHLPLQYPVNNVPLQYGTVNYGVPIINGGGFVGLDQGMLVKRIENGEFINRFHGGYGSDQVVVNTQCMVGTSDIRFQVGASASVFETSKELSSMPKTTQQYESTDICLKKKRFNGDHDLGCNGIRDKSADHYISPINVPDLPGFNQENNIHFNRDLCGFNARAAMSASQYPNLNFSEGDVSVVAIHRKCNTMGGDFLTEYEFFPGKNGKSTSPKEMEFAAEAEASSIAVVGGSNCNGNGNGGEASCVTTSDQHSGYSAASNASNSVDLSLKLSI